jgi:gluconolactonase
VRPNGLAFSPDELTLYVSDTGASHVDGLPRTITAYAMSADGCTIGASRTFATCNVGFFDGFRFDLHGNVWTSTGEGVRCYAPDGAHIGTVRVPEIVSNVCFGGLKRNRLFITAQTSLYAIYLNTTGAAKVSFRAKQRSSTHSKSSAPLALHRPLHTSATTLAPTR